MEFGVDYYPEQWEEKDFEEDFQNIRDLGADTIRMGEFAWASIEPELNSFNFSFFDRMMELSEKYSLKVILGTPTATPPPYLLTLYPDISSKTKSDKIRGVGIRRQASLSSPVYLERVSRIVEEMAKRYGAHPNLVGWQIDNEIGHEGTDLDYSENSKLEFRMWLKKKYETIENINKVYGTIFWSQKYSNFSEIPIPNSYASTGHHPSLIQDFYRFSSDQVVRFISLQKNIIRKYSKNSYITTNLYPTPFGNIIAMESVSDYLDTVSFDNYPVWGNEYKPKKFSVVSSYLQYIRGLKQKDFTIMEQISGIQGHTLLGYLPPEGQLKAWIVQAVLNGADKIFFFRYRTARYGQEQLCYGIFDHDKKINSRFIEIKQAIEFVKNNLLDYKVSNNTHEICVVHSIENNRNFKHQPISEGLTNKINDFLDTGYDDEFFNFSSPLFELGLQPEILPESRVELEKYKMIVLPLYTMVNQKFVNKIYSYVENGGILVLGYRAGFKDINGWAYPDCIPGPFKKLAGVDVRKFECHRRDKKIKVKMKGVNLSARYYTEILELNSAEIIAEYKTNTINLLGKGAITKNYFGKGIVYYLGASFKKKSFKKIYKQILTENEIKFNDIPNNFEFIETNIQSKKTRILLNHSSQEVEFSKITFKPFEVRILKEHGILDE